MRGGQIESKYELGEDPHNPYQSKVKDTFGLEIARSSQNIIKNRPFSSENKYSNMRR